MPGGQVFFLLRLWERRQVNMRELCWYSWAGSPFALRACHKWPEKRAPLWWLNGRLHPASEAGGAVIGPEYQLRGSWWLLQFASGCEGPKIDGKAFPFPSFVCLVQCRANAAWQLWQVNNFLVASSHVAPGLVADFCFQQQQKYPGTLMWFFTSK